MIIVICMFLQLQTNGQSFKLKSYILPEFGKIQVPDFLDTLSQTFAKKIMLEKWLDYLTPTITENVKNKFHVNFTKVLLASYDSANTLFWPSNALLKLLSFKSVLDYKEDTTLQNEINEFGIPQIKIQKKKFKFHSSEVKKTFDDTENLTKYTKSFIEMYTTMIYLISENTAVTNSSSKYYILKGKLPVIYFSFSFSVTEDGITTQYQKDIYSIYKDYSNFLFGFEYKAVDKKLWKEFEQTLFSTVQLY